MEKKKLNKTTKSNLITYGMVLAAYLIVQGMIAGNLLSNLMQGLLVPLCVYIILALSLNLTVGILGELSLGHAGFMCIGAFTSAAFTKATMDTFHKCRTSFLRCSDHRSCMCRYLWIPDRYSCTSSER